MQQVLVVGSSGSGKSTLARSLATRLRANRWLVEWQVIRRSLVRWAAHAELWNGNREPSPLGWRDPEHPVRWSWTKHGEHRELYAARFADPVRERLVRVRLRSRREVRSFLS